MGKIYKNRLKLLLMCLTTVILSIFILASLSGASEISENAIKMPIIMYHSVLKDKSSQNDYVISPDLFESDLKYFQENGYTTVTVNDLIDYVFNNYYGQVHISLGMISKDSKKILFNYLDDKKGRVVVYHTTSGYPVPFNELYLLEISVLKAFCL